MGLPGWASQGRQPSCSWGLCSLHTLAPQSRPAVAAARRRALPWRSRTRCIFASAASRVRVGRQQDAAQDGAQLAARGAGWQGRVRALWGALPAPRGVRPRRGLAHCGAAPGVCGGRGEPGVQGCQARQPLGRLIRLLPAYAHGWSGAQRVARNQSPGLGTACLPAFTATRAYLGRAGQRKRGACQEKTRALRAAGAPAARAEPRGCGGGRPRARARAQRAEVRRGPPVRPQSGAAPPTMRGPHARGASTAPRLQRIQ